MDDHEAVQSYPETSVCWHAGDGGGGTGNRESIAIEFCVNPDSDYDRAFENAAELAAQILKRNGIPISRMVQHNRWTGKNCPSQIRKRGEWDRFVARVQHYLGGGSSPAPTPPPSSGSLAVDGYWGPATTRALQQINKTPIDGVVSPASPPNWAAYFVPVSGLTV